MVGIHPRELLADLEVVYQTLRDAYFEFSLAYNKFRIALKPCFDDGVWSQMKIRLGLIKSDKEQILEHVFHIRMYFIKYVNDPEINYLMLDDAINESTQFKAKHLYHIQLIDYLIDTPHYDPSISNNTLLFNSFGKYLRESFALMRKANTLFRPIHHLLLGFRDARDSGILPRI